MLTISHLWYYLLLLQHGIPSVNVSCDIPLLLYHIVGIFSIILGKNPRIAKEATFGMGDINMAHIFISMTVCSYLSINLVDSSKYRKKKMKMESFGKG